MEETKPAVLSAATIAVPQAQVPASSTIAPVVLPAATPAVVPVPAPAPTAPSDKK